RVVVADREQRAGGVLPHRHGGAAPGEGREGRGVVRRGRARAARHQHARATGRGGAGLVRDATGEPAMTERLWAPWRMHWIAAASPRPDQRPRSGSASRASAFEAASHATASQRSSCLFCRVGRARDDRADLVLARRPEAMLMLNRYPYT